MPPFNRTNLTNRRFTRWVVLHPDLQAQSLLRHRYTTLRSKSATPAMWVCKCDCGKIKTLRSHSLLSGTSRSCGCLRAEERTQRAKERRNTPTTTEEQDFC